MLFKIEREALITLASVAIATIGLVGCAGPTTPFGGLNPWDLHPTDTVETEMEKTPALNFSQVLAMRSPASSAEEGWNHRKSNQDNSQPWVLMDPEQINYISPIILRIYIHDPNNTGRRPKMRLTYDDWDLTAKIKDKSNWQRMSGTDWQFTSPQIKFSPARVGELKVSFFAHQTSHWTSTKLVEPKCVFAINDLDEKIQQTGRFQVDQDMIGKIETLSRTSAMNPNLVAGLIAQESGFNTRAVSTARAIGLTQVTPVAEKEILNIHPDFPQFPGLNKYSFIRLLALVKMEEIGPDQEWRLDPDRSIKGGITYISMVREYWNKFAESQAQSRSPASTKPISEQEKVFLTLASYNSGPARVKKAYMQNPKGWLKDENLTEARTYVHKISNYCASFSNEPEKATGY